MTQDSQGTDEGVQSKEKIPWSPGRTFAQGSQREHSWRETVNWSSGEKAKVSFSLSVKINRKKLTNTRCKRCHGMVFSTKAHPLQRRGGCRHSWRAGYKTRPEV